MPNISPDPETGIGGWSTLDFVNAVLRGVSPGGAHFYPAFPYPSYARMRIEDVIDLKAFMDTLPPVSNRVAGHDLGFPFNIRRGVGVWKLLYLSRRAGARSSPMRATPVQRGQYLVEGPGHCGECHTSRDVMGGLKKSLWLAGAPNPEGKGTIPNITPGPGRARHGRRARSSTRSRPASSRTSIRSAAAWAPCRRTSSHLPDADLQAIAAYLKAVPPLPDAVPSSAAEGD